MAVSVLDPSVTVGLIFALFFLPMVLEAYVFGKAIKKEPLGFFFEYLFLSYIVTMFAEFWEWYSLRYAARTLINFKMITKLCLDIGIVILYIVGIIGLFVNMEFYIKTWFAGTNIIFLLLSIVWKIVYNILGARREVGTPQNSTPLELKMGPPRAHSDNASRSSLSSKVTPQTPSPQESRQLRNGNMGSNTDRNESDGSKIDKEEKTVDEKLVANISLEDGFSETNALHSSALEIEHKEQTVNRISVVNISPKEDFSEANANYSPACAIVIEAQTIYGNSVANISPEDAFSEANAQEPPGFETDLEAQSTMENYQSPCAIIYKTSLKWASYLVRSRHECK